jgi:hypothetical protein
VRFNQEMISQLLVDWFSREFLFSDTISGREQILQSFDLILEDRVAFPADARVRFGDLIRFANEKTFSRVQSAVDTCVNWNGDCSDVFFLFFLLFLLIQIPSLLVMSS